LWFNTGKYTRNDNALFIRNNFPHNQPLLHVADLFLQASGYYNEILQLLDNLKTTDTVPGQKITEILILIAKKEQEISILMKSVQ